MTSDMHTPHGVGMVFLPVGTCDVFGIALSLCVIGCATATISVN